MNNIENRIDKMNGFANRNLMERKLSIVDQNLKTLLNTRDIIHKRSESDIVFSKPLISKDGLGIIYPNTITVIQGKKGVHKSRLTEALATIFLDLNRLVEHLGFSRTLTKPAMVLYVDTERNQKDQLPYAMQKIRMKAGFPKNQNPEHFDFISLVDIPRAERFDTLKSYIELVQSKFKEYQLIVILDVITDCIENFNDPKESLKLIDLINEQANQKDVTFLCVIHENPSSSEKARGHLGTEIINKASQVIQIGFDSDSKELILLKFLHSRNTKSIDPLYLKYDEDSKGLVEANPNEIKLNHLSKQEKAPLNQVEAWFKRHLIGEMSKKDAYERLMNHFDCKDKTIDDRINSLIENDFLEKSKNQNSVYFKFKINF